MSEVELVFTTTAGWQQYLPLKREENMLDVIASDHDIKSIDLEPLRYCEDVRSVDLSGNKI
ncbi:MAG: hypothetical protein ACXAAR_09140, partial [Candidatus Thorarchaeota archaeon]